MNTLEFTWLCIGFMFGRAFGKQFDQTVQRTEWFKKRSRFGKWLVKACLNFLHHFWIGLLLMSYAHTTPWPVETYYFGLGLFLDDLPDVPSRLRRYFKYLGDFHG